MAVTVSEKIIVKDIIPTTSRPATPGISMPRVLTPRRLSGRYASSFTLVEMLVVIFIIGILAGVAIPRVLEARDRAETAHCASNLRAIHAALSMYRADFGCYPLADGEAGDDPSPDKTIPGMGPAANGSWDGVPLILYQLGYIAQKEIFFCPVMRRLAGDRYPYFRYAYNAGTSDTGGYAAGSNNIENDEGKIWLARCVYLLPEETFTPNARYPFPHKNHSAENVLYTDGRVVLEEAKHRSSIP